MGTATKVESTITWRNTHSAILQAEAEETFPSASGSDAEMLLVSTPKLSHRRSSLPF